MRLKLSEKERTEFRELCRRNDENAAFLELISRYLNQCPRAVTGGDVETVAACGISRKAAFILLFLNVCGLDPESFRGRRLAEMYLRPALAELDAGAFRRNPYLAAVPFEGKRSGRWELRKQKYMPSELFIRNNIVRKEDGTEYPLLGFFAEELIYPAVAENGREWMTVTPNEVNSMEDAVNRARGHVVCLGLGLGYFSFMAARKPEVTRVTVVERDPKVIELFNLNIRPYYTEQEKLEIVTGDAVQYTERGIQADFVFADLWHDSEDGTPLYLRMKPWEKRTDADFAWWAEPVLLSALRFRLLESLRRGEDVPDFPQIGDVNGMNAVRCLLSEDGLRRLAEGGNPLRE